MRTLAIGPLLLLIAACTPAQANPTSPAVAFTPTWTAASFTGELRVEDEIVRQVNALRRSLNLAPLLPDERLRTGARQHTVEMIRQGYYSHISPIAAWSTPSRRACHAGFLDPFVAENIGQVAGYSDTATALFTSWKNSPGHYANMVNPAYTRIGVGVASAPRDGMTTTFGTQLFAAIPLDLRNLTLRAERRKVARLTVDLAVDAGIQIKAWSGAAYVGDVPATGGVARFTRDLAAPLSGADRFTLAVTTGAEVPLVCVTVAVDAQGRAGVQHATHAPLCRRIARVSASTASTEVALSVLAGEALASDAGAAAARYYVNKVWGPPLGLKVGRWVAFRHDLPATGASRFALVLGTLLKDYLTIDPSRRPPFSCP
jgi:uncharacterized protein YkwD